MQNQATQPRTPTEIAALFGMRNPRIARITRDVKTKLGIAFRKGDDMVTIYESGIIETGPYTGQQSYSAYSIRNGIMTALRPTAFKFWGGAR